MLFRSRQHSQDPTPNVYISQQAGGGGGFAKLGLRCYGIYICEMARGEREKKMERKKRDVEDIAVFISLFLQFGKVFLQGGCQVLVMCTLPASNPPHPPPHPPPQCVKGCHGVSFRSLYGRKSVAIIRFNCKPKYVLVQKL